LVTRLTLLRNVSCEVSAKLHGLTYFVVPLFDRVEKGKHKPL